jgi:hypothetical protein
MGKMVGIIRVIGRIGKWKAKENMFGGMGTNTKGILLMICEMDSENIFSRIENIEEIGRKESSMEWAKFGQTTN